MTDKIDDKPFDVKQDVLGLMDGQISAAFRRALGILVGSLLLVPTTLYFWHGAAAIVATEIFAFLAGLAVGDALGSAVVIAEKKRSVYSLEQAYGALIAAQVAMSDQDDRIMQLGAIIKESSGFDADELRKYERDIRGLDSGKKDPIKN